METLGEYLRTLRELQNLPIRKVAAALDIDQSTLGKYERNERLPKRELLPDFASFYNVAVSELEKKILNRQGCVYPFRGRKSRAYFS